MRESPSLTGHRDDTIAFLRKRADISDKIKNVAWTARYCVDPAEAAAELRKLADELEAL